ncbi:MAG TPA: aminopeptidase [Bacteroidetes bacterium]|nr:aminopeptidase [Bacteroidota bacterium]
MTSTFRHISFLILFFFLCKISFATDPHSFSIPENAIVNKLFLDIKVDFSSKIIRGKAKWIIQKTDTATTIHFDTKNLIIEKVTIDESELPWKFSFGRSDEILGHELIIPLQKQTTVVTIYYSTTPESAACQWLDPNQTAGKKLPFMFTQCEAILARTLLPCQDSPGIRFTYEANVQVPENMLALMSAENPQAKNETGKYHFNMSNPIPSYLIALAVGDIEFKPIGERTGVYAEPSVVEKAAWEFADMQKMLDAAEKLYGAYQWGRYDVLVLPPSFPFGGMENPRLTFATPTVLTGDRSLVSLIAHEMAHSWSGNLVTNATWNDFWLNEGFTDYFERRITEALYGKSFVDMEAVLGMQSLQQTIADFDSTPALQCLKLNLSGMDPDEGASDIAYEKGYSFLKMMETNVGRDEWDAFLLKYFSSHAFQTMTTEQFESYLRTELLSKHPGLEKKIHLHQWLYEPGLPDNVVIPVSERFNAVDDAEKKFIEGANPKSLRVAAWTTQEWLRFINEFPTDLSFEKMVALDSVFHFSKSNNSEIEDAWFLQSLIHNYAPAYPYIKTFLINVGRRKFLTPLYEEMMKSEEGKKLAMVIYKEARINYHYVSRETIDSIIEWKQP